MSSWDRRGLMTERARIRLCIRTSNNATDQQDGRSACPVQCALLRVTHHRELCCFLQTPHPCACGPHTPAEARVCHHLAPVTGSSTHACRMYFNRRSKKIHSEGGKHDIICRHRRHISELLTRVFSLVLCCMFSNVNLCVNYSLL